MTDSAVNSPETVAVVTAPALAAASGDTHPTIRYATDAEVDDAMEKIFHEQDRLFAELAK